MDFQFDSMWISQVDLGAPRITVKPYRVPEYDIDKSAVSVTLSVTRCDHA